MANLHADLLDGYDASALRTKVYRFTEDKVDQPLDAWSLWNLGGIPDGTYLMSWDVNVLPFEPQFKVECGLTRNDYNRQWGNDTADGTGEKIAVWLSGAAVVNLDADSQHFYCQTNAAEARVQTAVVCRLPAGGPSDRAGPGTEAQALRCTSHV